MGVHADIGNLEKRDFFSPIKLDVDYLNKKFKNELRKLFTETKSKEKLKMRQWVNPKC